MNPCKRFEDAVRDLAMQPPDQLPDWAQAHLGECRPCRNRVQVERLTRGVVTGGLEAPPPAGFADRVAAALPLAPAWSRPAEEPWRPAWGLIPTFAAAMVAAIIVYQTSEVPGPVGFLSTESLSAGEQFVLGGASGPDADSILTLILEGGAQ